MGKTERTAHECVVTANLSHEYCTLPIHRNSAYAFTRQEFNQANAPSRAYGWGPCANQLGHLPGTDVLRFQIYLSLENEKSQ